MAAGFQSALGRLAGNILPGVFTLFLILALRVPFSDSDAGIFIPLFGLCFTYFFRLHFPRSGRLWFIFVLGLLEDYLGGGTLGLTSLILLLVCALFERQRKVFIQGTFVSEIIIFTFFSLGISVLYWLLASLIKSEFLGILPFLVQGLVTAAVYPLYVFLIGRINKRFSV